MWQCLASMTILVPVFYPFFSSHFVHKDGCSSSCYWGTLLCYFRGGFSSLTTCSFLMFAPLNRQNNLMGIFHLNLRSSWTNFRFSVLMLFTFLFWYQVHSYFYFWTQFNTAKDAILTILSLLHTSFYGYLALSRPCPHLPFLLTQIFVAVIWLMCNY